MRYMGGKARQGKKIAEFINKDLEEYKDFYEPFVGGFNIIPHVKTSGKIIASDIHLPLISMYKELASGWVPPSIVTENNFKDARLLVDTNPLKAFIGFGCAFSGKYLMGYAKSTDNRNYAMNAKNSLIKKLSYIKNTEFYIGHYIEILDNIKNSVIYLDPPYINTEQYKHKGFNHNEFWKYVKELVIRDNIVYISEYTAPDWVPITYTFERKVSVSRTKSANIAKQENLYRLSRD